MSNPSKDSHPQSLHYDVMYLEICFGTKTKASNYFLKYLNTNEISQLCCKY